MMQNKYIFGICGGSGVGKTTVSDFFRDCGITVIDGDKVARDVVIKGKPCLRELVNFYSDSILNSDGTLNRRKLGKIVFSDKESLEALNKITLKYIKSEIKQLIATCETPMIAIDGATIFESGLNKICNKMVGVLSDFDKRVQRLKSRDQIDEKLIIDRICSQKVDTFYIENCDYLIYNNKDTDYLYNRVKEVASKLNEERKKEAMAL